MPNPAVPTRLRVLRGNPQHRPIKDEPEPAQLEAVPEPPAFLNEPAAREWSRLAPELIRIGLLTVADLAVFSAYCQSYGRWVDAEEKLRAGVMKKGNISFLAIAERAAKDMHRYATEFGLTPSSRARLAGLEGPKPTAKFEGLLAR